MISQVPKCEGPGAPAVGDGLPIDRKMERAMRRIFTAIFGVVLFAAGPFVVVHAGGGSLPQPPAGFKTDANAAAMWARMKEADAADGVMATKQNASWPNCFADPLVHLEYGWSSAPGGDMTLELMAKTPEDPATTTSNMVRDEPAGKQRYKNGILWWRKQTWQVVGGSCKQKEIVLYQGHWAGYVSGKMVSVSVSNLYGDRNIGQGWIDDYIQKIISSVSGG